MNAHKILIALLATASMLTGCASELSGDTYSRGETRREMQVIFATVESVRPVQLEGTRSPVGTIAGAVLGGIVGSTLGRGRGSDAGVVLGAVVGGAAGSAVEEGATRRPGLEVTVRLDNGEYRAVVQEDVGDDFRPGDRVRLLRDEYSTRVTF